MLCTFNGIKLTTKVLHGLAFVHNYTYDWSNYTAEIKIICCSVRSLDKHKPKVFSRGNLGTHGVIQAGKYTVNFTSISKRKQT